MTRGLVVVIALAFGCDRDLVPSPRAQQAALDDADARRLEAQLATLPGVRRASVVIHRPVADPLARNPVQRAPGASIVIVSSDASIEPRARALAGAVLDELRTEVVVVPPTPPPPTLASVGPFEVTASSATPLRVTLALALVLIAGLAGVVAYRERWRLKR